MKNITSKEDFLLIKNQKGQLNEGFFGSLFKGISNLTKNIKGGGELNKLKDKYQEEMKKAFSDMTTSEQEKTANKNIEKATEKQNTKQQPQQNTEQTKGQEIKTESKIFEESQTEEPQTEESQTKENLNKKQLQQKIKVVQDRLKELKTNFNKELEILKNKYKDKKGNTPKKLEKSLNLASIQFTDWAYEQWQNYFKNIGNQKALKNIQNKRAENAKEMKKQTEELKNMMSDKGVEKRNFEINKKYKYINKDGEEKIIKIKELDKNGDVLNAEIIENGKVVATINPFSNKIGNAIEEKEETKK